MSKTTLTIPAPRFRTVEIEIEGTAPYMQARFSAKAMQAMMAKMAAGNTAKSKKVRDARDFDEDFQQAQHISTEGWNGIPAAAFRGACISACKIVNFHMTKAKLSIFVEADGFDAVDGAPLVRLIGNTPEKTELAVRIGPKGVTDIRVRPMWRKWGANLRVRFDEGQFTIEDVINLVSRVGMQVGIGEGRPDSKSSAGLGYGLFEIKQVNG